MEHDVNVDYEECGPVEKACAVCGVVFPSMGSGMSLKYGGCVFEVAKYEEGYHEFFLDDDGYGDEEKLR